MAIGIIGMLAAIAVMIIGAYRGIKAIPLTILAALVVIAANQMEVWSSLATLYAGHFGSILARFFFIFISSSIYAMFMEKTGSTASIGHQLIKWFGKKHVMAVVFIFTAVLTYGGVSLFVVFFAALPVAFVLFKEANLPRAAIMAPMGAGGAGITMTTLPGTPALTNIIPSQFLGTPLTAAPVFSLIMAAIIVALSFLYFRYVERTVRKNGEVFTFPPGFDAAAAAANADKSNLPHPLKAFIPIATLILFLLVSTVAGAPWAADTALLATLAMIVASLVCLALNPKRITLTGVKNWIGDGSNNGITAIVGLAAVVAFGNVVSNAPAFQAVLSWVMGLEMNVYFMGLVSTGIISGITGSSSGGAQIALANLGEYFIAAGEAGANLEVLHRLIAMGAGTLDTLPHVSAIFLFLALLGCTHKEAYKYLFWPTVVIPSVVTVLGVVVATIIW